MSAELIFIFVLLGVQILTIVTVLLYRKKKLKKDSVGATEDEQKIKQSYQKLEKQLSSVKEISERYHTEQKELEKQKKALLKEKEKVEKKNRKIWQTSEAVYREKKKVDEKLEDLESEKTKFKEKNKKLWSQSIAIHKEKERVEEIRKDIEIKHKNITESINYAQLIQIAILPSPDSFGKSLTDYFILYKPRDIVSGDFYWMTQIDSKTILAAADCTGHGVPGAFMSMLGSAFLNEIVNNELCVNTDKILDKLRHRVIIALKQKGELGEQKDGMDMAICSVDHNTNTVQFSGANNPLYIIRNGILDNREAIEDTSTLVEEVKGDKMPIAIYIKMDAFTAHSIPVDNGDMLYMFSDGFPDQFGGPIGKKFKYKPMKKILVDNAHKSMSEQKEMLEIAYQNWVKHIDQNTGKEFEPVDDIIILGFKI